MFSAGSSFQVGQEESVLQSGRKILGQIGRLAVLGVRLCYGKICFCDSFFDIIKVLLTALNVIAH